MRVLVKFPCTNNTCSSSNLCAFLAYCDRLVKCLVSEKTMFISWFGMFFSYFYLPPIFCPAVVYRIISLPIYHTQKGPWYANSECIISPNTINAKEPFFSVVIFSVLRDVISICSIMWLCNNYSMMAWVLVLLWYDSMCLDSSLRGNLTYTWCRKSCYLGSRNDIICSKSQINDVVIKL